MVADYDKLVILLCKGLVMMVINMEMEDSLEDVSRKRH
jgi:hypothetical protein